MKKYLFIFLTLFSFGAFSQGIMTSTEAKNNIVTLSPQNVQSRTTGNLPIQSLKVKRLTLDTLIKVASEGVNTSFTNKADLSYVNTQLATKTTATQVNTIVAPKIDSTRVKSLLNLKADLSALNSKVETATFNSVLSTKANSSDLASKANTSDVNALLNFKVNNALFADTTTAIRNSINTKASISYANQKKHVVSTNAELIAWSGTVADFDGSTWEKKTGNVQSNGGSFAGTLIRVSSTVYWERKIADYVNVSWFGAVADGTTNNAVVIAAAKTSNMPLYFGKGNWVVNDLVPTIYYGEGIILLPSGLQNFKYLRIGNKGNFSNFNSKSVFGVIRQNTANSGWYVLNDTGHQNSGIDSISTSNGDILVTLKDNSTKVGSVVVGSDEVYSAFSLSTGSSVGFGTIRINISGTYEAEINMSTFSIAESSYFLGTTTIVDNSNSTYTITYPTAESAFHAINLQKRAGNSDFNIISQTATTMVIDQSENMAGYIEYNGTTWVCTTTNYNVPTMSFAGNVLTVTHESTPVNTPSIISRNGTLQTQLDSVSNTGFQVVFKDFSGVQQTTPNTAMRFYYSIPSKVRRKIPYGNIVLNIPHCKIDAAKLYGTSANFWIMGEMIH